MTDPELEALGEFDWVVGGPTGNIVADTQSAHAAELAEQRAEILKAIPRVLEPTDVVFCIRDDGVVIATVEVAVLDCGYARPAIADELRGEV